MLIGLACIDDIGTGGRYFENASTSSSINITRLRGIDTSSALLGLDLLLVVDPMLRNPETLRAAPCPVAGYVVDVHQYLPVRLAYARYFDHVFVAQPNYLDHFRALPHPSAHWLPLACDPVVHFIPGQERIHDVGFVGKLGYAGTNRRAVLEYVLPRFRTNDYTRFYTPPEMGEVYSRSKIVFNKSINGDVNMRVFEALASGALLITDRIANGLRDVATEGVHYVGYETAEEAVEKISYFLAHEEEREAIAAAGQKHVFAHHTYAHRLASILDVVQRTTYPSAPARSAPRKTEAVWRSDCLMHQGARPAVVGKLLLEGNLSRDLMRNAAIAASRGIIRPIRQAIGKRRAVIK